MKFTQLLAISLIILLCFSCKKEEQDVNADTAPVVAGVHKITAEEVIHTDSYTYIKAREGDQSYWIAVAKLNVDEGATLYYPRGMEMKNFESKDLNRTFDSILFVDSISDQPPAVGGTSDESDPHARVRTKTKQNMEIPLAEGGITIGHLYANKSDFENKHAIIRGKVIKFNPGIMGRNWVHIQDGSETDGKFDLTITTDQDVTIGDIVTFSGTIVLDKDFGAGYAYEVIMENAKIVN